ncbi:hypothetical protein AOLI_G00090660 [Acnodon oligacanthus]
MAERLEAGAKVNNSMKGQKRRKGQHKQHKQPQKVGVEEDALPAEPRQPLLRGIFQIGKTSHDVLLTASRITWTPIQPEDPTGQSSVKKLQGDFVDLTDVFAVKVKRRRSVGQKSGGTLLGITVFVSKRKGAKLKDHAIHLNNLSADHCEIWFKHLKDILNDYCWRWRARRKMAEAFGRTPVPVQYWPVPLALCWQPVSVRGERIIANRREAEGATCSSTHPTAP